MADPDSHWIPRATEISSTTLMAAESNNHQRCFKINTRAGETFNQTMPVNAPLTAGIVDDIIAKLGSSQTPLQDLYVLINAVAALRDAYQGIDGLTDDMKNVVCAELMRSLYGRHLTD